VTRASFRGRLTGWLLDHRLLVTTTVCVATVLLVYPLGNPQVLFQRYDAQEDQGRSGEDYKQFASTFHEGELMMAVIQAPDVFAPEVLSYVRSRTSAIREVASIRRVDSLATVPELVKGVDGGLQTHPLLPDPIPTDHQALERARGAALANPLCANNLISADSTVTVINIVLPAMIRGSSDATRATQEVRGLLSVGRPEGVQAFLTGLSPMFVDSNAVAQSDFQRFAWMTGLLMTALLFLAFWTLRGVLLPLGVTSLTVLWTLGLMAWTGQTISAAMVMLPTLIAIVCLSDAVHILAYYYERAREGADRRSVLLETMEHMSSACFLTSITTALAFASLALTPLSTLRQFGLWAGAGIMVGYGLMMVLMPVLLSWLPLPAARVQRRYKHSLWGYLLARIVDVSRRGRLAVPIVVIVIIVASVGAATRLRVQTSMTAFLPESAPSMRGWAIARERLAGFSSVEVVLDGRTGVFEEPWALEDLRRIAEDLRSRSEVSTTLSVLDLLQWIHGILREEGSNADLLADPNAPGLIAEYLFMFRQSTSDEVLNKLVTNDSSCARVSARLGVAGAGEQLSLVGDLDGFVGKTIEGRLDYELTGEAMRIAEQIRLLIRSLAESFGFLVVAIGLLMLWQQRSVKAGLLAMIPNILPVLLTIGVMGAIGMSLNYATIMITSIAIGIAVDDTIHFLVRYRRERQNDPDRTRAVEHAILHSGRAMAFTSITIAAGCGLFVFSDFAPTRTFGFLMAFTMLMALLADLVVLPYLIKAWKL